MSAELIAIGFQIAFMIGSAVVAVRFYKKEKRELMEKFNLEDLKDEFTEIVDERLQTAIDTIGEAFGEILSQPTVKKAFSIIGSQGGEARAENIAVDEMAKDMLDGPQFAAIRMGAEALGLDIESYIEKHGAIRTISAAQQLAKMAGIDLMNIDLGNLSIPGPTGNGNNPYFRR